MLKPIRLAVIAVALTFSALAAHAQIALYANLEADNVSVNAKNWYTGGTFGLYDDYYHLGPLHIGADLRGSILKNGNSTYSRVLGGFRAAAKPPVLPIKPYVQISAGVDGFNTPSHLTYEINGGVDLTFLPHLDWRVAEVGGGPGNQGTPVHIATGLVFRFF